MSGGTGHLMKFLRSSNEGILTLGSPLQNDISLNNHLQLVGYDLTVGVILIFAVETERKKKKIVIS